MNAAPADAASIARRDAERDRREREAIDKAAAPAPAPKRRRGACADCCAFDSLQWASAARGYCKARPPVVAVTDGGIETVFPIMPAAGWCMAWKPAA